MTADDHPEELLDRAIRGSLGPAEQSTLERHLAECAACAAHLAQAPRWKQELAPQPRDEMLDQHAVEAAMLRLDRSSSAGRSRAGRRWLRLAAAGLLLASGVTAVAAIIGRKITSRTPVEAPVVRPVEVPSTAAAPPPVSALAPPPSLAPVDAPAPPESPRPSALRARPVPPRPAVTAAALFEHAGRLRREGQAEAAIAAYRRLQETFPGAREAQVSFALAGQLLLERGRPREALAQFERHPRSGGDVGEEALAGRATALEQLHRNDEAIAAWKALLASYPRSIYVARARARLAQLVEHR